MNEWAFDDQMKKKPFTCSIFYRECTTMDTIYNHHTIHMLSTFKSNEPFDVFQKYVHCWPVSIMHFKNKIIFSPHTLISSTYG